MTISARCSKCGCHTAAAPYCFYCRKPTTQHADLEAIMFPAQRDWDALREVHEKILESQRLRELIEERLGKNQ